MKERSKILKLLHNDMAMRISRRGNAFVDVIEVPGLCRRLLECVGALDYDFASLSHPFALRVTINNDSKGQNILDPTVLHGFLLANCSDNTNVFTVNFKGLLIQTEQEYFSNHLDAADYSEKREELVFFIANRKIDVLVAGKPVDCIPNASSFKKSLTVRGDEFSVDEWPKILKKYDKEIQGQKRFEYWAPPKKNGLLVDSPEKHFRKDLAKYFEENLIDCWVDEEAYNDRTTNRVDIRILSGLDKDVYYFELKCLGRCKSNTEYDETHAHEGLVQVNSYVNKDAKSVLGVLVVFDGRNHQSAIPWPDSIKDLLDKRISLPPAVMKLELDSASTAAKETVKKLKKDSKI